MGIASLLWACLLGWLLMRAAALRSHQGSGALGWFVEAGLGTALGLGLTSALFFVEVWLGIATPALVIGVEAALAIAAAYLARRNWAAVADPDASTQTHSFRWTWLLALGFTAASLFFFYGFYVQYEANPQGHWDTWAIWNLRARFLAAGGEAWRGAVSPLMPLSHPEYPLLWPGVIGRAWLIQGSEVSYSATAIASLLCAFGAAAVLAGAVAQLRSAALGWLAGLLLLATNAFVFQSSSFYADVPLSLYVLSAISAAVIGQSRAWDSRWLALAGVFASLAAWTKNEGILFLAAFLAVLAVAARRSAATAILGAVPVGILVALFKTTLAPADTIAKASAFDFSRFPAILSGCARTIWNLGEFPAHPVVALAVCAFALRFTWKRERLWVFAAPLLLLLGDFVVIAASPNDLKWLLGTTMNRLVMQVWPALLLGVFLFLRIPASAEAAIAKSPRSRDERSDRSATPPHHPRQRRKPD